MKEKSPSTWDIITAEETALLFNLNINTLYHILNSDPSFPAVKLGGKWLVYKAKIPEWFEQKLACKKTTKIL